MCGGRQPRRSKAVGGGRRQVGGGRRQVGGGRRLARPPRRRRQVGESATASRSVRYRGTLSVWEEVPTERVAFCNVRMKTSGPVSSMTNSEELIFAQQTCANGLPRRKSVRYGGTLSVWEEVPMKRVAPRNVRMKTSQCDKSSGAHLRTASLCKRPSKTSSTLVGKRQSILTGSSSCTYLSFDLSTSAMFGIRSCM
jgi:hypothetical protein